MMKVETSECTQTDAISLAPGFETNDRPLSYDAIRDMMLNCIGD